MKTALVVEDNENNMELITFILESSGYQTLRADSGRMGIEIAVAQHPDFIILDIQLPDMNGKEVLRQVRGSGDTTTPIIAMTSYAMAGDREKLLAAGCTGYIEKPIDPKRVIRQIKQVIGDE